MITGKQGRIFLSPPHMGDQESELVREAFKSNYIAPLGPMVDAFEQEFAEYTGIPHCLALSSGTAAMHLALRELGVGPDDLVLASTLTFIGSVTPATFLGASLVFIDAEPNSWNMDVDLLSAELAHCAQKGRLPKALIPTDLYGQCVDLDRIQEICAPYEVPVVLDSAESVGAKYKAHSAGYGAKASVFSFNGNKIITTSGGGMLASADQELIEHARKLSQQARDSAPHYQHSEIGYNYRMSNVLAAIGRGQLRVLDQRVQAKRRIFEAYRQLLGDLVGIEFMPEAPYGRCNRWLTVVLIDPQQFGATPEQLRLALEAENIESRPIWKPMHLQPIFQGCRVRGGQVSEYLFAHGLCLPSGTAMTDADIERVCKVIKKTRMLPLPRGEGWGEGKRGTLNGDGREHEAGSGELIGLPLNQRPLVQISGSPPPFIPFAKVACDGSELNYVREVLESGWLTSGGKVREFERKFAGLVGARYACAVNSCTAALHLALEAIGVAPGDKVLVPTLTFTASAEVIRYLGADPIFLDVEPGTGLLTPEIVEEALEKHLGVKAAVVVHLAGQAAQMKSRTQNAESSSPSPGGEGRGEGELFKGILEICKRHGVRVVEDAAHAFPTQLDGRMVGTFGDVTCFSFYANKTITTGEGGMLVTNDEAIYHRAKIMRLHGIDRDIWNRFTSDTPGWEYDVVAPGFKYNMPDVNAAIGLAQLERADWMRQERQRCFEFYLEHLADCEWLDLPLIRCPLEDHSCHLFWVVLNENAPVSRNRFIELLSEAGIGTSVHYKPLHRMTYYRERYKLNPEDFPNAEKHWQGCVSLPVYPTLTNEELSYVVGKIKGIGETKAESRKLKVEIKEGEGRPLIRTNLHS